MTTIALAVMVGALFYLAVRLETGRIYTEHQRQAKALGRAIKTENILRQQVRAITDNDHAAMMELGREVRILRGRLEQMEKGHDRR